MTNLHNFSDIHTHRSDAPPGAIVCVDPVDGPILLKPGQAYSVGIHPWNAGKETARSLEVLKRLAHDPQVVAIGEAGLDPLKGRAESQEQLFRQQALLAEEVGKPLIIHCVKRWDTLLRLKREIRPAQEWIIHGFRGNPTLAKQLVGAGFSISLGQKFNPGVPEVVPPAKLYHETD